MNPGKAREGRGRTWAPGLFERLECITKGRVAVVLDGVCSAFWGVCVRFLSESMKGYLNEQTPGINSRNVGGRDAGACGSLGACANLDVGSGQGA